MVGLLAGDDGVEGFVGFVLPQLHELCPLQHKSHQFHRQAQELFESDASCLEGELTEYRFGLFSFSVSLYWMIAFKCGSWSSTYQHRKNRQSQLNTTTRTQKIKAVLITCCSLREHEDVLGNIKGNQVKVHTGRVYRRMFAQCVSDGRFLRVFFWSTNIFVHTQAV